MFPDLEIVSTATAGFALLEHVLGADRLVVVDAVLTGTDPAGTVHVIRDADLPVAFGPSPHYVGLWEVLALGRALGLPVPEEVVIIAVEAQDCTTLGRSMDPAVRAAIPSVLQVTGELITTWRHGGRHDA